MNIRDLRYLVAIAEHRHFGLAAQACFVSQPALSMQIKKLEDTLGVQLIERTNKSVSLTDIGHAMSKHAHEILTRVDAMQDAAKLAKDPYSGEFRLGLIPTLAPYLLPKFMPGLSKAYPKLQTYLVEDLTPTLISKLRQGKIDAAIIGLPCNEPDLFALPLFEEEFLLAVPAGHALCKRSRVTISDLKNRRLLLLEDGHCMRDFALELCFHVNAEEDRGFQATSLETLRQMVAAKAGITLMPALAHQAKDGLHYLPFSKPKPTRVIGIVWRISSARSILLNDMVTLIRKMMTPHKAVRVINTTTICRAK